MKCRCICLWIGLSFGLLNATDRETWLVHYTAEANGFLTSVNLINGDFSADHQVTLEPFAADGTLLDGVSATVAVLRGKRLQLTREDLNWVGQPVSHVRILGDDQVRVNALYRAEAEAAMSASVASVSDTVTSVRFTPSENEAYFDGLVLTNPFADAPIEIDLSAHDGDGNTLVTKRVTVSAGAKWLSAVSALFEEVDLGDGYVEAHSSDPFMAMGLRGSRGAVDLPVLTELSLDFFQGVRADLSFNNQVSRILQRNCNSCHYEGGIGPLPLTTFEETAANVGGIDFVVKEGLMPPWKASTSCEPLLEVRVMDPAEKQMLLDWISQGSPEGEPERLPEAIEYGDGQWQLGPPDAVLQYPEAYVFEAGADQYQCFPIALGNRESVQLDAIEILPDNDTIVHHVLVFVEENTLGQELDAMEEGPGYTCFGGPGTGGFRLVAGWAPGMAPLQLPDNVGMTLGPNATAIVQVHYSYAFQAGSDQTQVGFYYSDTPRDEELLFLPLVNDDFVIPAGADDHEVTQSFTIPFGLAADLYFIAPHMHLLGKNISVDAEYPDGSASCLIDIPQWDFNWQRFYGYPQPIALGQGTRLTMKAFYDNSNKNPFNPSNPPIDVGWGEATTDEMALVFLGVVASFSLGKEVGEIPWPKVPDHGLTPPDVVRRSLEAKRKVKPCCNDLAAQRAGAVCPTSGQ